MQEIPQAKDTDSEDVVWGLQTAASLWKRGERSDAVAWLRRAAQAASDANDDDRALELARAAAELSDLVTQSATMMPTGSVPSQEETTALDALPQDGDPISSQRPSVPPADKLHAGMFDPWNEGLGAAVGKQATAPPVAEEPAPAVIHVPSIPSSPDLSSFTPNEIVTSVNQVPSRPPKQTQGPPRVPSKKPPPLPPRALAAQSKKAAAAPSSQALPESSPKLPASASPKPPESARRIPMPPRAKSPASVVAAPPLAPPRPITVPPDVQPAQEVAPLGPSTVVPVDVGAEGALEKTHAETKPRFDTPAPPSPTQQQDLPPVRVAEQEAEEREPEDAASVAETTPPPPREVPPDEALTPYTPSVAARVAPLLSDDDLPPTPLAPPVAATPGEGDTPKLDLENVELFADLPDDARAEFANAGKVHVLAETDEVAGFALAYIIEGNFDVAATMVDAPAVRLAQGAVLRSRGTTEEGVPMRIVSATPRGVVATWSEEIVEAAFKHCPWVDDDLRAASDRVMTLVGITIGPLGERLDQSLREEIVGRLTVRSLIPGEIVVNKGEAVPGLLLVGVGEIELVDGDAVKGVVGSGDFLFATEVLSSGPAPQTARAGAGGALVMFGNRSIAQELMVTCPPLLEVFAGM